MKGRDNRRLLLPPCSLQGISKHGVATHRSPFFLCSLLHLLLFLFTAGKDFLDGLLTRLDDIGSETLDGLGTIDHGPTHEGGDETVDVGARGLEALDEAPHAVDEVFFLINGALAAAGALLLFTAAVLAGGARDTCAERTDAILTRVPCE
ncbi:hypothetical protein RRF57_005091 [Xylaria bambusicola]|uniref:Uncharacterized protein n=1 Tax=Xylaria bambusicola TaxID=326684 RepID=A0AAN7Z930_9PEZI